MIVVGADWFASRGFLCSLAGGATRQVVGGIASLNGRVDLPRFQRDMNE